MFVAPESGKLLLVTANTFRDRPDVDRGTDDDAGGGPEKDAALEEGA
jgi:hypothetical protein